MIDKIEDKVLQIYHALEQANFEAYFVGGCVRDMLLNRPIKDWDIATNADPEQIQSIFPDSFYDNTFGTVGIPYETNGIKQVVEITTYRTESTYSNNRHPDSVSWGKTIEEDLERRDFTMNAIALRIKRGVTEVEGTPTARNEMNTDGRENDWQDPGMEIIDPFNGQTDIKNKLIRAVRNPNQRFKEDALRIMRAIRFAAQLNFEIEEQTWQAICEDSSLIAHISYERIRDELLKILGSENPLKGIELLDQSGILEIILPELMKGKGISQVRPGRHHTSDVFTHNLMAMYHTPNTDPIVKLAALLHDVGKPYVASQDPEGHVIFYNHEVKGAEIANAICERLRLSNKQKEKIVTLIRWHMFTVDEHITDGAVRRFIRRVGLENVSDMIDVRIGDRLGSGTKTAESWRLKQFKEKIEQQLNPPFSINDLAIDGNDIMKQLNIKPGPKIGKLLQTLFEEVDENLELNTKKFLIKRVNELR